MSLVKVFIYEVMLERLRVEPVIAGDQLAARGDWIPVLNTLGAISEDVGRLLDTMWAGKDRWSYLCCAELIGLLVGPESHRSMYGLWTPESGGGGPGLLEVDALQEPDTWMDRNRSVAESLLQRSSIEARLAEIARVGDASDLASWSELAAMELEFYPEIHRRRLRLLMAGYHGRVAWERVTLRAAHYYGF